MTYENIIETEGHVSFDFLGTHHEGKVLPLEPLCATCARHTEMSNTECQKAQGDDARQEGFKQVICPHQIVEEKWGRIVQAYKESDLASFIEEVK